MSILFVLFITVITIELCSINGQVERARNYHREMVERIENSGLSQEVIEECIAETRDNTEEVYDYELYVERIESKSGKVECYVRLSYNIAPGIIAVPQEKKNIVEGYAGMYMKG